MKCKVYFNCSENCESDNGKDGDPKGGKGGGSSPNTDGFQNQKSNTKSIQISPNPFKENLFLENVSKDDKVLIIDMLGNVLKIEFLNYDSINTNNLSAGIYNVVVVRHGETIYTALFVKH